MKIIYFVLILIFLYLLFTKVKVVHISQVPPGMLPSAKGVPVHAPEVNRVDDEEELKITEGMRQVASPSWSAVMSLIQDREINDDIYFNMENLPVKHRRINSFDNRANSRDVIYKRLIKKSILSWNNLIDENYDGHHKLIALLETKIASVKETDDEAIITAYAHIKYSRIDVYLRLTYHIINNRSYLLNIRQISKRDFMDFMHRNK